MAINQSFNSDTFGDLVTGCKDISGTLQPVPSTGIDSGNSTSVLLTANSTFTGAWVDVSLYSNVSIIVFTDQVSAVDGFKIEYSTDGTNIDDNDLFTIPASNGQQLSFPLTGKYYRIRYVNGVTNQGAFRLQSKLHAHRPKPSSQRLGSAPNLEQDAELIVAMTARISFTASAPTFATVGIASGTVIATNSARKGLIIQNTSTLATVSLHLNNGSAVLNSGITLYPHDIWYMDEYSFTTAQINAISSLASTNVSVQELI